MVDLSATRIRSWVERISRNRVVKRRMPAAFGSRTVYVSASASPQFWKRDLSGVAPELFRLADLLVKPGDVVWDVGANIGLFSFAAAARAGASGSVLAIEPDPWLGALLRRSAGESNHDAAPVTVLNLAISDRIGMLQFNVAERGRASNFLSGFRSTHAGVSGISFPVMAVPLDQLADHFPLPSLIKIDVEAMEHVVLAGAQQLLRFRPTIVTEVDPEHLEEVSRMLAGYRLLTSELQPFVGDNPFSIVALPR